MLITVTTTTQKLSDILSTAQKAQIDLIKEEGKTKLTFQNLGGFNIYVEHGAEAVVLEAGKIKANIGTMDFRVEQLADLNLISDGTNNANVRLITR